MLKPYSKAIAALLTTAVALLVKALSDGNVTGSEWREIAGAALVAAVGVYFAPTNKTKGA